ncbi:hypothetical protein OCU04_008728 [Sclerotinia nivalis]|uniref:Major facilitator superfamily (MFS) profile domain-containing protein n=1 Tax=Sclerotinia nivalis TaxID=352851 RepID=A0A9X0AG40_9HELO|nr:hypothetical protein OCU04_008728 [Sclerotinia nivalis]
MKLLGLRIGEPKPEYRNATKPLDHVKRLHDVPKKDNQSIEDCPNSQESDGSLPLSGASSHKSTDIMPSTIPCKMESLRDEVEKMGSWASGGELKFRIMELAISDIGMGRHQWHLFVLCGIGWAADNLWLQGVALILPSLSVNFEVSNQFVRYATLWFYVGLSLGAAGWGVGSDIIGRRLGFNSTLVITGIFALGLANASSFTTASIILAAVGFGVGGSLPVDGTMFLEFLPHEKRSYLTLLSIWWPIGQVVTSLLAWLFLGTNFDPSRGWRFFIYSLGGITFAMALARLLFDNIESPKYLLGINKQAEAVRSVRALAHKNGTHTWLTEEILNEIGGTREIAEEVESSTMAKVRQAIASFGPETIKKVSPLFGTLQLSINTVSCAPSILNLRS